MYLLRIHSLPLYLSFFLCCTIVSSCFSQAPGEGASRPPSPPIQVELHAGHNKLVFQNILIKPLDKNHRFDFFNISYFDSHYQREDKPFNEGLIQTYVAYNVVKGIGFGIGGTYNTFGGVAPNLVSQFVNAGRSHLVVFFVAAYLESTPKYEAFTQLQYRPHLRGKFRLFTQLMALTNWVKLDNHSRSFAQLRLGLDYKSFQFGLGADIDAYGPLPEGKQNIGLFIRKEIFN